MRLAQISGSKGKSTMWAGMLRKLIKTRLIGRVLMEPDRTKSHAAGLIHSAAQ